MDQLPCPDGYLLDTKSPLADGHHSLNTYLVRVEDAGWKVAMKELSARRDKGLKVRIWKALLDRLEWLHAENPHSPYFSQLHDVTVAIEGWKVSISESDVVELLGHTGALARFVMPYCIMPHLMSFVQEHGLTPALSAAIREFHRKVKDKGYSVNQTTCQLVNSQLDMLAWRDEWSNIDLKRCWSERVRADFRGMQGPERELWRRLLHSIDGDEGVRPAANWLGASEAWIKAIGEDAFRTQLLRWLKPLAPGTTHPLSREGSYLLRSFLWLAASLQDEETRAVAGAVAGVKFKPKRNGEKVLRVAADIAGLPDPIARPAQGAPTRDSVIERALKAALSVHINGLPLNGLSERLRFADDVVHINGDLDQYQIHVSTGAIFRRSDGRRVSVSAEASPFRGLQRPELSAFSELLARILILAEDAKHAGAVSVLPEEGVKSERRPA